MNEKTFDEKQLRDRGQSFFYGLIAALVSIVLAEVLVDIIGVKIEPFSLFLICVWLTK